MAGSPALQAEDFDRPRPPPAPLVFPAQRLLEQASASPPPSPPSPLAFAFPQPPASPLLLLPPRRDLLQAPRQFFAAWQRKNELRAALWEDASALRAAAAADAASAAPSAATHLQLTTLHLKLEDLKVEIASLIAQDIELFRHFFSLQETILELREQNEFRSCSSGESSPCSTLSSSNSLTNIGALVKHSSSFVRHHVSYPPIARNRSYRIKSSVSHHGCQDSYDSGIHTSDHEIFV